MAGVRRPGEGRLALPARTGRPQIPWACWRSLASAPEGRIVALTALVEAFVLVSFASAGAILTSRGELGMSSVRYGQLVVPEMASAIVASLSGFGLARRYTTRSAYRLGLTLGVAAMALIPAASAFMSNKVLSYSLLLAASAFLGAGFGVTVPVLMAYARFLNVCAEDASLIALNALIALGALAGPGIAVLLAKTGTLWGLAVVQAVPLVALLLCSARLPSHAAAPPGAPPQARGCPVRFLLYAVMAISYAVCAAIIVIWSQLVVAGPTGRAAQFQLVAATRLVPPGPGLHTSVALASFWGATLAAGRVMLAAVDRWHSVQARVAGHLLPILVLAVLIAAGVAWHNLDLARAALFVLAGFGCSALLPLAINFTPKDVTAISAALAGGVIAYQLAYGIVAYGVRPPLTAGASAMPLFVVAALIGLVASVLSLAAVSGGPGLAGQAAPARAGRQG